MKKNIEEKLNDLEANNSNKEEFFWDDSTWDIYKEKLVEKLRTEHPHWVDNVFIKRVEEALHKINPIFENNLLEYINGSELSYILVGSENFIVKNVLSFRQNMGGVIETLKDLSGYSVNPVLGKTLILNRSSIK